MRPVCVCALFLLVIMLSGCTAELTSETVAPVDTPALLETTGPAPETTRPVMTTSAPEETQPPAMTTTAPMATTTAPETTAPPATTTTIVIDAEALFMEKCNVCHPYTRATSKRKTREQWESTVNRMVTTNGGRDRAGITDGDAAMIVDYLAENYGL